MTHDCWWHQERIEQAQRENDQKTLDFYRRFSNKPNPSNGIKAMAENCADYEQFLACGFTDEYETKVNEYGWFEHEIRPLEDIMVYNEPKFGQARIRLAQLPNGKWIHSAHVVFRLGGFGDHLSIFNEQFSTRLDALFHAMRHDILSHIHGEPESVMNAVRRGLDDLWLRENQPQQLELF
jgi:hypothetical protein